MILNGKIPYSCTECNHKLSLEIFDSCNKTFVRVVLHATQLWQSVWESCATCNVKWMWTQMRSHSSVPVVTKRLWELCYMQCIGTTQYKAGLKFFHLSFLELHKMIHTGKIPYCCTECNHKLSLKIFDSCNKTFERVELHAM